MIAVRDRRDAWVGPSSRPEYGLRASLGWWSKSNSFNQSEMALFNECMLKCARKLLDTADIVREAIYQQAAPPGEPKRIKITSGKAGFGQLSLGWSAVQKPYSLAGFSTRIVL